MQLWSDTMQSMHNVNDNIRLGWMKDKTKYERHILNSIIPCFPEVEDGEGKRGLIKLIVIQANYNQMCLQLFV